MWTQQVRARELTPAPSMTWTPQGLAAAQGLATAQGATPVNGMRVTADGVPLAGWWRRLVATVIDTVIVSLVTAIIVSIAARDFIVTLMDEYLAFMEDIQSSIAAGSTSIPQVPASLVSGVSTLNWILLAATALYSIVLLATWSATLGQRLLGMRVVPLDKGTAKLSVGTAILRGTMWSLLANGGSLLVFVQAFSGLMPLWHPKRQTIPDLAARTQVVRHTVSGQ